MTLVPETRELIAARMQPFSYDGGLHVHHPAYEGCTLSFVDPTTDFQVLVVSYRETEEYDGGTEVEVYDPNGDLQHETSGSTREELVTALLETYEGHVQDTCGDPEVGFVAALAEAGYLRIKKSA